ncbi:hypothetical protein [Metabacillus fastidiosus]|uniref:hypothetical protein n=1 Tax=Metabacillus fastidiosus TaxID=1458 RepID=UPI002E230E6F|nr:hypothetical protein [Metabacillus fastidiosus]
MSKDGWDLLDEETRSLLESAAELVEDKDVIQVEEMVKDPIESSVKKNILKMKCLFCNGLGFLVKEDSLSDFPECPECQGDRRVTFQICTLQDIENLLMYVDKNKKRSSVFCYDCFHLDVRDLSKTEFLMLKNYLFDKRENNEDVEINIYLETLLKSIVPEEYYEMKDKEWDEMEWDEMERSFKIKTEDDMKKFFQAIEEDSELSYEYEIDYSNLEEVEKSKIKDLLLSYRSTKKEFKYEYQIDEILEKIAPETLKEIQINEMNNGLREVTEEIVSNYEQFVETGELKAGFIEDIVGEVGNDESKKIIESMFEEILKINLKNEKQLILL